MLSILDFEKMNDRLISVLSDVFGVSMTQITPNLKKEDLGSWDSLKQMDLVISLEREFGISLQLPEIVKLVSVKEIKEVLVAKGVNLED
jgi:acyl carrier protein